MDDGAKVQHVESSTAVMDDRTSPFERILNWLRAGYPEGVPTGDYVALLGILQRALTSEEVERLAQRLRESDGASITDEHIRQLIRRTALKEPSESDVRRVAGRLAQGGWPLDGAPASAATTPTEAPKPSVMSRIERIVNWLKGGYPHGIPEADYVPLLAVLRRRLSADEINELAERIVRDGLVPAERVDVGVEYLRVTNELPSEAELQRVSQKLADAGIDVAYVTPPRARPNGGSGS